MRVNNGVENNQAVEPVLTPVSDTNVVPSITPMPIEETPVITNSGVVENTPTLVSSVEQTQQVAEAPTPVPTTVVDTPTIVETAPPESVPEAQPTDPNTPVVEGAPVLGKEQPKKKKSSGPFLILLIVAAAIGFAFYTKTSSDRTIDELYYKCSPVNQTKEEKELDVKSTLVQSLYSKVYTSINEDYAQPEWNDTMKLYLAYRQLSPHQMYDSNCNMFKPGRMEPYVCEESTVFIPKAFPTETLRLEWKKLFGEETPMPIQNIKLEDDCIGGFEYIEERDEFVQGYCKQNRAHAFRVKKEIKKAVSSGNTITLTEKVDYSGNEKMTLPDYLKSGKYVYTFKLDMNYNYIFISKEYQGKYE